MESDAVEAIANSYAKDVNDEFVLPTVITENGEPIATVNPKDSVIFFNFRPDRARQMTRAFVMKISVDLKEPRFHASDFCMFHKL